MSAPAQQEAATRIRAVASHIPGRQIISAGTNHFVADRKASVGGPGEAVQAGELLLASLASCALAVIGKTAEAEALNPPVEIDASLERDSEDGTRYREIVLAIAIGGVTQQTAERLVAAFTDTCPIYNTIRRGGSISVRAGILEPPS